MEFHIIDDYSYVGEVIAEALKAEGYSTRLFSCPSEYIRFSKSEMFIPPVAILTDIKMPKMSGYELIDQLHSRLPNQKFVVISATPSINHPTMRKVSALLHKPLNFELLVETAASLAASHSIGPEQTENADQFT